MIFAPGATYQSDKWYVILPLALFFVVYFAFVLYLVPYLLVCLGYESLASKAWVRKYYRVEQFNQLVIKTQCFAQTTNFSKAEFGKNEILLNALIFHFQKTLNLTKQMFLDSFSFWTIYLIKQNIFHSKQKLSCMSCPK